MKKKKNTKLIHTQMSMRSEYKYIIFFFFPLSENLHL